MADGLLTSDDVNRTIDDLILSGRAETGLEAERMFLDESVEQIATLVLTLPEAELTRHAAVRLLMAHGSRPWEDELL